MLEAPTLLAAALIICGHFAVGYVTPHFGTNQLSQRCDQAIASFLAFPLCARKGRRGEEDFIDDDDEGEFKLDQDWRSFRAKLVMQESQEQSTTFEDVDDLDGIGSIFADSSFPPVEKREEVTSFSMTPLDPSQWAYDSGKVIEQGAVILGGVEQDFGFGLRQQYFHKAAILVLSHGEDSTVGIILNRPTDLTLDDDVNEGVKWQVWFGGDVEGLNSPFPHIVCLHTLRNEPAMMASTTIMNDIKRTSFDNAKELVRIGAASPTDFWVFCGYAGWAPKQLMGELDRKSWYMVTTDPQTLLKELARLTADADPRDAGLGTWNLLMGMIGRKKTADDHSGGFDDLMLKEWALKNLLSSEAGGGSGILKRPGVDSPLGQGTASVDTVDNLLARVAAAARGEDVRVGSLVRGSAAQRSPFLLDDQELHKSVVLMLIEDDNISIGVVLNRAAPKSFDISIQDSTTGISREECIPLRYGGRFVLKGAEELLWLHCSDDLKKAGIGSEIGENKHGIWKCSSDDAAKAIGGGLARKEDFIVVSGVSVWTKTEGHPKGMQGEVARGNFEVIPSSCTQAVWSSLCGLEVLSAENFDNSLANANKAWEQGSKMRQTGQDSIGDGAMVFDSDTKVRDLSDKAMNRWVAAFLLGVPNMDI